MVSVAFAIWLFPLRRFQQQATCQFPGQTDVALASILHDSRTGADPDDVDVISGLSEPYGPDGALADGGCVGTEISQSRSPGHLRQIVRTARRGAGTDLALVADLYPAALWHR